MNSLFNKNENRQGFYFSSEEEYWFNANRMRVFIECKIVFQYNLSFWITMSCLSSNKTLQIPQPPLPPPPKNHHHHHPSPISFLNYLSTMKYTSNTFNIESSAGLERGFSFTCYFLFTCPNWRDQSGTTSRDQRAQTSCVTPVGVHSQTEYQNSPFHLYKKVNYPKVETQRQNKCQRL